MADNEGYLLQFSGQKGKAEEKGDAEEKEMKKYKENERTNVEG